MDVFMMGKYSAYVWSSFGITAAVLIICTWQARRRHAQVLREIERRLRAMEAGQ